MVRKKVLWNVLKVLLGTISYSAPLDIISEQSNKGCFDHNSHYTFIRKQFYSTYESTLPTTLADVKPTVYNQVIIFELEYPTSLVPESMYSCIL